MFLYYYEKNTIGMLYIKMTTTLNNVFISINSCNNSILREQMHTNVYGARDFVIKRNRAQCSV